MFYNPQTQGFHRIKHDAPIPSFLLKTLEEKQVSSIVTPEEKEESDSEKEKEMLYCVSCLKLITSGDQRIRVDGSHEHTCKNPSGMSFRIGCFKDAPGAVIEGLPTIDFTWFKGFHWSMTYCGGCFNHVGWQFLRSGESGFLGLVLNRLTSKRNLQ